MKITIFKNGLLSTTLGSFWWGILGVFYFKYFSFVGHLELVIHRCLWTALVLILTTIYFSKLDLFLKTIKNLKNILKKSKIVYLNEDLGSIDKFKKYIVH